MTHHIPHIPHLSFDRRWEHPATDIIPTPIVYVPSVGSNIEVVSQIDGTQQCERVIMPSGFPVHLQSLYPVGDLATRWRSFVTRPPLKALRFHLRSQENIRSDQQFMQHVSEFGSLAAAEIAIATSLIPVGAPWHTFTKWAAPTCEIDRFQSEHHQRSRRHWQTGDGRPHHVCAVYPGITDILWWYQ